MKTYINNDKNEVQEEGFKQHAWLIYFYAKMGGLKLQKRKMFSHYIWQIKRFRRSGKLIENEGPNCIKKSE